jgi:hypothetical protein
MPRGLSIGKASKDVEGLLSRGFRVMPFDGMKAGGINVYRTSIFYRDNNCLGI